MIPQKPIKQPNTSKLAPPISNALPIPEGINHYVMNLPASATEFLGASH